MSALSDVALLRRLVSFNSVSRNSNLPILDFLCDYLERPGVRLERNFSADGDKANLIAVAGPEIEGEDRPGLVLSGHMDVVPADEEGWHSDPFDLTERDGELYGRGAADMKGFLALAANAFGAAPPERLTAPLALIFTYDEEVGTLGAKRLADTWSEVKGKLGPLPQGAVIGEPTELAVVRMHKGHVKLQVTLTGASAHSGYPHLGDNAIEKAGRVIAALTDLRRALEREPAPHREHFPEVPYVPLNLGIIRGGSAVNVVPDRCTLELGARPLPGMESRALAARIARAIEELGEAGVAVEVAGDSPPMLLAEEAPIYRALTELAGGRGGDSVSFATDAGWLQTLGFDCAVWGPGSITVAHRPNEHVPRADLTRAAEVLGRLVDRFCMS